MMSWLRRRPVDEESRPTEVRGEGGGEAQEQFITDALQDLRDTFVREVMTPRIDVVALTIPLTVEAVTKAVRESGHGCFPVHAGDLDELVGVLYVNDLFRAGWQVGGDRGDGRGQRGDGRNHRGDTSAPDPLDISRRLRQPFLVPESWGVLDALAAMREHRRAFAIVVDEHGGVEGVLTTKDLLGALVGDLPDEFDPDDEPDIIRVDGSRWLLDGRASVDDVGETLGMEVPDGEYVTLGGYLFDILGHIPVEGEVAEANGWELRITEMDKRRIAKVVARKLPGSDADEPGSAKSGDLPPTGTESGPVG
jgi:CBS domain containing-hemolysin-like protein